MKITSKTINYTVNTVDDLLSLEGDVDSVVVVTEENRGGTFIKRLTAGANDNGIWFNGWERQYDGAVNVKWFGAKGDGATDDTVALLNVFNNTENSAITFNGTYLVKQLIASCSNCTILGNNSTIVYTEQIDTASLNLTNCSIENMIFDGGDFNIGENTISQANSAIIYADGSFFSIENVVIKNLHGLENNYQYGVIVSGSTISNITQCRFSNIKTRTNTANTGGFCGGYFIFSAQGESMTASSHRVTNCVFEDIYTTQNASGEQYWDSDGVRSYFYDFGTGVAGYDTAVKSTTITVTGSTFTNVLKSAVKVNHATLHIDGCRVTVDDMKDQGQTHSYVGFRYQVGHSVKISNCSVVGQIRCGAHVSGSISNVSSFYFGANDMSGISVYPSGLFIGSITDIINTCTISDTIFSGTSSSVDIYGAEKTLINNCNFTGDIVPINASEIIVSDSYLDGMVQNAAQAGYNPTIDKIVFSNCRIDFASDGFYCNYITTNSSSFSLVLSDTKITNCRGQFLSTTTPFTLNLSDVSIDITSIYNKRLFDRSASGKTTMKNVTVTDLRVANTPDALIYADNIAEDISVDGLEFTATQSSNYMLGVLLNVASSDCTFRNITMTDLPDGVTAIRISQATYPSISNLRCNYPNAKISLYNNLASVVNMFHGTLATTHIITGGTNVISEYNTTKF